MARIFAGKDRPMDDGDLRRLAYLDYMRRIAGVPVVSAVFSFRDRICRRELMVIEGWGFIFWLN